MTNRQSKFLQQIIESYAISAEPVASGLLAGKANVSSATIRNEMAALEEEGYILQPHTSAGRIPTKKGYEYYLENFLAPKKPNTTQKKRLDQSQHAELSIKAIAKELAELSNQAVLVAFANNDFYYTGISKLFSQPEFHRSDAIVNVSVVLDALDETLEKLYETAMDEVQVLLGKENPFSQQCSLLIRKANISKSKKGVMAILGPVRMNYNQNIGLLNYSAQIL